MPRGDGTGPAGLGPMTGRAAGYCAGYPVPGFMNPIGGRGLGFGRGFSRCFRWRFWTRGFPGWGRVGMGYPILNPFYPYQNAPNITGQQEIEFLKNQVKLMQEEINSINEYIYKLEQEEQEKK